MRDTVLFGDCRETLGTLRAEITVGIAEQPRMCVTSPPYYGLRDYGGEDAQIGKEDTPEEYINNLVEVFSKVRDVLTEDGTLWLNMGDSYYNYRPGKGQALVQQTVSNTSQDLPQACPRRGNILPG